MKTYAHVVFLTPGDRGGAEQQRTFTNDLISAGIIQMTKEKIEEYFQKDKKTPAGALFHIVLHNRKERKAFQEMMERPDYKDGSNVTYYISMTPQNNRYDNWLKNLHKIKKMKKQETEKNVKPDSGS